MGLIGNFGARLAMRSAAHLVAAATRLRGKGPAKAGTPNLPEGIAQELARVLRPQAAYRWLLPQLAAITPQYIEMTLRGALAGNHLQAWEIFDLMEDSWPRLAKNLNEVKGAVLAMDWKLYPYAEEDEAPSDSALERQAVVSAALRRMRPDPAADENAFNGMVYDILDAWAKGMSVQEVSWESRGHGRLGQIIAPRAAYWVHPTCYAWDMTGRLGLRSEIGNQKAESRNGPSLMPGVWQSTSMQPRPSAVGEFPPDKFLIAVRKAKSGSPLGGAMLRPLAWWWCCANFSADWLLNLAQTFGLPFRWASYDRNAAPATIDAICSMLENMGSAGWAAFPEGTTLELKEPAKAGGASPQDSLLDRADKQADLLVLGQTLTGDVGGMGSGGGSLALGKVHAGVKDEVVQAAANFAAGVLNTQLVLSIVRLNYGEDDEAPEYRPQPQKAEDALANAQRDQVLMAAGMPMPKAWLYKRHDVPLPTAEEEMVGGEGKAEIGKAESRNGDDADDANGKGGEGEAGRKTGGRKTGGEEGLQAREGKGQMANGKEGKGLVGEDLMAVAGKAFCAAQAEALGPVRSRLKEIQALKGSEQPAALRALQQDLPELLKGMNANPATAKVLERALNAAWAEGMEKAEKLKR